MMIVVALWWNDEVQKAIKEKKECFKRLHLDKSTANIESYKLAKRVAKRAVSVAKGKAFDDLYQWLGTKEGGEGNLQEGQDPRAEDNGHQPNQMH